MEGEATMQEPVDTYYALYFDDVASAVEYCRSLVDHIVPRASAGGAVDSQPIVWFHVPRRCTSSTRDGCYLFASPGAYAAANRAGLDAPMSGYIAGNAVPTESVLLFGSVAPERAPRSRFEPRAGPRRAAPPLQQAPSARASAPTPVDVKR